MAFLDKMKDSLTTAGQEVSQKAKNATENVRINNLIKSNEKLIEKITYQVGMKYVNEHITETGTEYEDMLQEILRLKKENEEHQQELAALTASNTCSQCGYGNNASARFCINCGAPLNPQPAQEKKAEKVCTGCGCVNEEEALFCVECGCPLSRAEQNEQPETSETLVIPEVESVIEPVVVEPVEPIMPVVEEVPVQAEPIMPVVEEAPVQAEPVVEEVPVQAGNYCKNCGAVLLEDALFCTECGTRRE